MTERPWLVLVALVAIATGCVTEAPSAASSTEPSPEASSAPIRSTAAAPTPTSSSVIALPQPGRPFDAAAILAAMRDSRRPGGVPDEIETDAIAIALADAVWTFDGAPWTTTAAGGSCGPQTCTLELAGTRDGLAGDDLWVFSVSPATGRVEVVSAELRSLPADLPAVLDGLVRTLDVDGSLSSLIPTSVKWLPPPAGSAFVVSYRSGGEEGSCGADVTLDALGGAIVAEQVVGC
ncbi:MAG: hypothetical protein ACRDFY_06465 [Candidatus Limnocylindria bacterium]